MIETEIPVVEPDLIKPESSEILSEKEQLEKIIKLRDEIVEKVIEKGRLGEYLDDLSDFITKLEERDKKLNNKKGEYRKYKVFRILANSNPDKSDNMLFDLDGEFSIVNFFSKLEEKYLTNFSIESKAVKNN